MTIGCPVCRKSGTDCDCPASIRLCVPLVAMTRDAERTIRTDASDAIDFLIERLTTNREQLVELAVERATSIGAREYGEAAWAKSPDELLDETDDELSDAIVYVQVRRDVLAERALA